MFLSDEFLSHYNTLNGIRLTDLTCSKAPGFWMVEHQLVNNASDRLHMPLILGVTWMACNNHTQVFAWIFATFNSLQL